MKLSRCIALEIFGLKEDFSEADLKREYRRLIKIVHPDTGGDEKLFRFIDSCKSLLINGDNVTEDIFETSNHKSNSYRNRNKSEKENAYITLEALEEDYPYDIKRKERKYNIIEIRTALIINIVPIFRKNLEKCIIEKVEIPYSKFNSDLGLVKFNVTIKIPEEMKRFQKFKVRVEFLNHTFKFKVSDGDFKVIKHQRRKHAEYLKAICELHFEK